MHEFDCNCNEGLEIDDNCYNCDDRCIKFKIMIIDDNHTKHHKVTSQMIVQTSVI